MCSKIKRDMAKHGFIDELRRNRFGIGVESSHHPLATMLQGAIKLLSAELYQDDIHFISELLQNAEDNSYRSNVTPSVEIILTKSDLTGTKAPATLLLFNNEVGFSEKDIESLCSTGHSTKKGKKAEGYIGEKGIGFKSVFLVSKQPYIISNGYRFRFNEDPDFQAGVGYVVPEWVDDPTDDMIRTVYKRSELPNTVFILPLRKEKVEYVMKELIEISPEALLFLKKISKLSLINDYSSPPSSLTFTRTVEAWSMGMESSITCLEGGSQDTFKQTYYTFKQTFRVPENAKVDQREGVDQYIITLAFPVCDRVSIAERTGNVFSFLPTQLCSGFNFLINADFLLVSSRATLRFDSPWNQGILDSIPDIFVQAFTCMLKSPAFGSTNVPSAAISSAYKYVPYLPCRNQYFVNVRKQIICLLQQQEVILCASNVKQPNASGFCLPGKAKMVDSTFRSLLESDSRCRSQFFIVDGYIEAKQRQILYALGVTDMENNDYVSYFNDRSFIFSLTTELYVKLLEFVASRKFERVKCIKYLDSDETLRLASKRDLQHDLCIYWNSTKSYSELFKWIKQFKEWISFMFIPPDCATKILKSGTLKGWLSDVKSTTASEFAKQLFSIVHGENDPTLVILVTHFFFALEELHNLDLSGMPVVDNTRQVRPRKQIVLLPASVSKWPMLLPNQVWCEDVTKMSDDYLKSSLLNLSDSGSRDKFLNFLQNKLRATDIPQMLPIRRSIPVGVLFDLNAVNLLGRWIAFHGKNVPSEFMSSIRDGQWLRTSHGLRCPKESFLLSNTLLHHLQVGDVPTIDWDVSQEYIGALELVGVATDRKKGYGAVVASLLAMQQNEADDADKDKVIRLYSYLASFPEKQLKAELKVWVGSSGKRQACWRAKEECLIEDSNKLFEDLNIVALNQHYTGKKLLSFFEQNLGVAKAASIDKYHKLWDVWSQTKSEIEADKCQVVWSKFVKQGDGKLRPGSLIPCVPACATKPATVNLKAASDTVIADDLEVEQSFQRSEPCLWVAWYPTSQTVDIDKLYQIYCSMGVKKLSESVVSETTRCGRKLEGEKIINVGLVKIILAVLAKKSQISCRQNLVEPLLMLREVRVESRIKVMKELQIGSILWPVTFKKTVFWDKKNRELLYVSDKNLQKEDYNAELGKVIASGVLCEHGKDLVSELSNVLEILANSDFEVNAVNAAMVKRNLRLCDEDEALLARMTEPASTKEVTELASTEGEDGPVEENSEDDEESADDEDIVEDEEDDGEVEDVENNDERNVDPVTPAARQANPSSTGASSTTSSSVKPPMRSSPKPSIEYQTPPELPRNNSMQMLQGVQQILSSISNVYSEEWTMEISDEIFNSDEIRSWRAEHLLTIRHTLGYPPEENCVKIGMRRSINLDKLLTAAFSRYGRHLIPVGGACLNLWSVKEIVKTNHELANSVEKLANDDLLADALRATELDKCVLNAYGLTNRAAADVLRAILAVGFAAYDDGLEEVRRLYQYVFLPALTNA